MSEFAPLEERLKNAMRRISAAVEALPADQSAALAERDARIASLEEAAVLAANVTDDMADLRAELDAKTAALQAAEQAQTSSDEIEDLRAQLDAKTAELEAARSGQDDEARAAQDAEIEATLLDLQGQLSVREDEIKELKAAAAQANDPAEIEAELTSLRDALRQKDDQIDSLTESLAAKDTELASMPDAAPNPQDTARIGELEAALAHERAVNADLGGRVNALKTSVERNVDESAKREAARVAYVEALDEKTQRLQQVNADLRTINGRLRKAVAEGSADAELINRAMEAELDALREARDTEAAEVSAILNELQPIIEGTN